MPQSSRDMTWDGNLGFMSWASALDGRSELCITSVATPRIKHRENRRGLR